MLIIGNHVSPYARKVLVALAIKGIDAEIDPMIPFYGTEEFTAVSPLRRIPVLIDGDLVLNDSTAICEYLDETYPDPPLMPRLPAQRARARWLEEYADSRLSDLIVWRLFFPTVVAPWVFNTQPDPQAIATVTEHELPEALDWIEGWAPQQGFLFGHVCTVDIAYACFFRNAAMADWTADPGRWPRTAAWLARIEAIPEFAATAPLEALLLRTPPEERREALRAAGARVSERSYAGDVTLMSLMLAGAE